MYFFPVNIMRNIIKCSFISYYQNILFSDGGTNDLKCNIILKFLFNIINNQKQIILKCIKNY
jgi:hypothetical protein